MLKTVANSSRLQVAGALLVAAGVCGAAWPGNSGAVSQVPETAFRNVMVLISLSIYILPRFSCPLPILGCLLE